MVGVGISEAVEAQVGAERLLVPARRSTLLWRTNGSQASVIVRLFGLSIADTTVESASRGLVEAARGRHRLRVVFANAHVVNEMATRAGYRKTVETADRTFADGSGLAVAARLSGTPLADNVNGTDLFPRLAADALKAGERIFLIGGSPGTAEAAARRMNEFGFGASIAGYHHGFFTPGSEEEDAAIAAANTSGASIVLVGMGVPLQDEWIAQIGDRLVAPVRIGVGGLFDYFAGHVSRAPHAMRVIGCEWIWRLALEPRRMARRYLLGNVTFLGLAITEAIRMRYASGTLVRGTANASASAQ